MCIMRWCFNYIVHIFSYIFIGVVKMKNQKLSLYVIVSVSTVAILLVLMLGSFAGGLVLAPYVSDNAQAATLSESIGRAQPAAQLATDGIDVIAAYEQALIDLYEDTLPSVVSVRVTKKIDGQTFHEFDFDRPPNFPAPGMPEIPRPYFPPRFGCIWPRFSVLQCRRPIPLLEEYWARELRRLA